MAMTTEALVVAELGANPTLETIQIDELRPDEALVEIHTVGLCHTDISCIEGTIPVEFPAVLGHEGSNGSGGGVLLKAGAHLTHLTAGSKVLLSFNSCGICRECVSSFPSYCQNYSSLNFGGRREDGSQPLSLPLGTKLFSNFFGQSAFSKLAIVNGRTIVQVPQSTDLALFAPLGCGIQTGAGTILNTLDVRPGQSLVVFGVGAVGLACVMAGKLRGADPLIAVDIDPTRLDLAIKLGATHGILASDITLGIVEEIKRLCPGNGVQRAVDCSGVPSVIEQMIKSLGSRGKAATVGAPAPGKSVNIDVFTHIIKGTHYIGSCEGDCVPSEIIPYLIEKHSQGLFPLEELVTVYDGKDFTKAFEDARKGMVVKAVLRWK
ncbi:hypothetical protein N7499_003451 [Penicillium canescens]|uniref:Alcohol dehydrogenase n=1 Tax=Penicillium canescens TaxID=5083 RepID=A0AAD6IAH2_PENCN|nr:uncharacterized protein N7446_012377 [Penicillium canescens]KAJ6020159.1 hypothetical protein N7522_000234 [Penicillium canescens]KAJ6038106.1 hypothetical protein N7460_007877 [Penicillium canescens]KAJ6045513.1 hypothetical protein N7446_012377 [Penicillium canescens]KAJ6061197.1 hypothetical protein N7444_001893 [Penicillium canescens]KAJ6090737.1 hypothetical protein N7499_003451 [Penicillium canescens]